MFPRALQKVAFIDLEASGLSAHSWPIEAGWCFAGGEPTSYLIRPAPAWDMAAWDEKAEALHGVSSDILARAGAEAAEVCAALNEALTGCVVYSDAPDWDGFWLYRLFQAARVRQTFALVDFHEVFAGIAPEILQDMMAAAAAVAPHRHRAGDDVLHMKTLYELAAQNN